MHRAAAAAAVTLSIALASSARGDGTGYVEAVAGESIPLASETYQAQTKLSPKLGRRGGYHWAIKSKGAEHPWTVGAELGLDFTPLTIDPDEVAGVDGSRVRILGGVRFGGWRSAKKLIFIRAALGVDHVGVTFEDGSACGNLSSSALAAEMGGGVLLLAGRIGFGLQGSFSAAFHRDAGCGEMNLTYDSFDLDLLLTLGVTL
jgi:hypothetical protein